MSDTNMPMKFRKRQVKPSVKLKENPNSDTTQPIKLTKRQVKTNVITEKISMTAKERQRKCREKMRNDPTKHELSKLKNRERMRIHREERRKVEKMLLLNHLMKTEEKIEKKIRNRKYREKTNKERDFIIFTINKNRT